MGQLCQDCGKIIDTHLGCDCDGTSEVVLVANAPVLPGVKYGIFGELIPSCRSVNTLLALLEDVRNGIAEVKLWEDITMDDKCQRGPNGDPLPRVTPGVPYQTMEQWNCR